MNKKGLFIVGIWLYILSAFLSYVYFSGFGTSSITSPLGAPVPAGTKSTLTVDTDAPKTEKCPLNGKLYPKAFYDIWKGRRPLGVMIENHVDARPQSGLSQADIVFEAVAEGGITRFLTIFYCQDTKVIGPVRSARMYFLKLLQGYGKNPLYAHVGGANTHGPADALGEINELGWDGYNDLNQFAVPYPYYYRDYERLPNRATEHTMYAATSKLWKFAAKDRKLTNVDKKGASWDKDFTPWEFKDEAPASNRGKVAKISFPFWSQFGGDYSVTWTYDKKTNTYSRINGGDPFIDKNTGKTHTAKSIIVVFAKESAANDGYPGGHMLYGIVGSGDGILFQDGKAAEINWKKPKDNQMITF